MVMSLEMRLARVRRTATRGFVALVSAAALCALASTLQTGAARAASKDGQFAVKGPGLATCERYTQARAAHYAGGAENPSTSYISALGWISGYISAYNQLTEDTLDVTPWQSLDLLALLIDNYCKQNPTLPVVRAMDAGINALKPGRLRSSSENVTIESGGNRIVVYREILRRAQQILLELGHYDGELDGLWGSATQAAFEAYQTEQGIQVSGVPDQNTLLRLFR